MSYKSIIQDIRRGENIDLYVTIVISGFLVILNLFNFIPQSIVNSVILVVLTLITITNLINRGRLEYITDIIDSGKFTGIQENYPVGFTENIESAREIVLTGIHHSSTMSEHYASFEKMVRNGGRLRIMVADPDGAACRMTAMRFAGDVDAEQERTRARNNIKVLGKLSELAPERVEIRTIDYLFEYNAFLINPDLRNTPIYLQRYTFKTRGGRRKPKIVYTPDDGEWYDLICSEVLAIWDCGKTLDIKSS